MTWTTTSSTSSLSVIMAEYSNSISGWMACVMARIIPWNAFGLNADRRQSSGRFSFLKVRRPAKEGQLSHRAFCASRLPVVSHWVLTLCCASACVSCGGVFGSLARLNLLMFSCSGSLPRLLFFLLFPAPPSGDLFLTFAIVGSRTDEVGGQGFGSGKCVSNWQRRRSS